MTSDSTGSCSAKETLKCYIYNRFSPVTSGHQAIDTHNGVVVQASLDPQTIGFWKQKQVNQCGSEQPNQSLCAACRSKAPLSQCGQVLQLLQQISRSAADAGMACDTEATATAVQSLLSLCGCVECCQHCSRAGQQVLGEASAVQHLVEGLRLQLLAQQQQDGQQLQQAKHAVSDILQSLLFCCCGSPSNLQQLVAAGGLDDVLKGLTSVALSHSRCVQVCCCLIGEAAAVAGSQHARSSLVALGQTAPAVVQQLVSGSETASACSSCCAVIWATSKVVSALCQTPSTNSEHADAILEVVDAVLLPVLQAAVQTAAALSPVQHQQQQHLGLLVIMCLASFEQSTQQLCHKQDLQELRKDLSKAVTSAVATLSSSSTGELLQAYWRSLQQENCDNEGADPSNQQQLALQHLSSCQFLAILQQQQHAASNVASADSNSAATPVQISCVPGATATIEVVYAGCSTDKANSSHDNKQPAAANNNEIRQGTAWLNALGNSGQPAISVTGHSRDPPQPHGCAQDPAVHLHAEQQQDLLEQSAAEEQAQLQHGTKKDAAAMPGFAGVEALHSQQRCLSAGSMRHMYADASASSSSASVSTIGTLLPRSDMCSSASSSSIQACGDGQSSTSPEADQGAPVQSGKDNAGSGGGGAGEQWGMDSSRDQSGQDGSSSGNGDGGQGGHGGGGADDEPPGDDLPDRLTCASPPSDDSTPTPTVLSSSADSIHLAPRDDLPSPPAATSGAAEAQGSQGCSTDAPISLGCSTQDPIILPRPPVLGGVLPGLMLAGSAAAGGAPAVNPAAIMQATTGTSSVAGMRQPSRGPLAFPTHLTPLSSTAAGQQAADSASTAAAFGGGSSTRSLLAAMLSPHAYGASAQVGLDRQAAAAPGPGFGPFNGPGTSSVGSGRRASDVGSLSAASGVLGTWGFGGFNPDQVSGGGQAGAVGPVGSWPSSTPGFCALQQHVQEQQQQQQQQQQQPHHTPPQSPFAPTATTHATLPVPLAAAGSSASDPLLERRALSGYLTLLNPSVVGLIGSGDPSVGEPADMEAGSPHLISWLTEPASCALSTASSGPVPTVNTAASAGRGGEGEASAGPHTSSKAATASQTAPPATANVPAASCLLPATCPTELPPHTAATSRTTDTPRDTSTKRDQRPAGAAAVLQKPASASDTSPATAKALPACAESDKPLLSAVTPPQPDGPIALSPAGSGSSSSAGSSVSGVAHSCSGGSFEDLESLRLSSASFAAALEEAEAIAANVAASMAAAQQQVGSSKLDGASALLQTSEDCTSSAHRRFITDAAGATDSPEANADDSSSPIYDPAELTKGIASRHLWLGNLHQRLPRSLLRSTFERFGPVEDVVTFPGRMYAFVNFKEPADAARAAQAVQDKEVPTISGNRRLVVKFRPSRRALGKVAEAMVPGLVDPSSAAQSDKGSASTNTSTHSSHAGSCTNLVSAAALAGGDAAGTSCISSHSSMGALPDGLPGSGSDCADADITDVRSGSSSSSSQDVGGGGTTAPADSLAAPDLPPGLNPRSSVMQGRELSSVADADGVLLDDEMAGRAAGVASEAAAASTPGGISDAAAAAAAVAAAAAAVASGSSDSNAAAAAHVAAAAAALAAVDAGTPQGPVLGSSCVSVSEDVEIPEGKPSRHLWLGNIPLKPNRGAMEALFSRFGPLESVRVFPGKTFAFVNFVQASHAIAAKAALDGQPSPLITGPKPVVIRFQKDHAGISPGTAAAKALEVAAVRTRKVATTPHASLPGFTGVPTPLGASCLTGLGDEDLVAEPAVNLSNKLNPNNIHYDRELAARYKRMSKAEKEALWAQDRALQQLEQNPAAASLLSAAAAAAAAAAATGATPGLQSLEQSLQTNPAAAAAAASSLYSQFLTNPQLTAALAAQGNPAAAAAAAAAAGFLQHSQSALTAGGSSPWGALGASALSTAGLNASTPAAAAAAAAAAASGHVGGYFGQMGGLGGTGASTEAMQTAQLHQYLAARGLNSQMLQQALLQQQLASSFSGLSSTSQDHANLAAFSALDPAVLQAHLTSGLPPHSLSTHLSSMGSGLSMQGSGLTVQGSSQQQQGALPSTTSVTAAGGVASLLGMSPNGGGSMARCSTSGMGFGAAGGLGGPAVPRSSFTGTRLGDANQQGTFPQLRVSSSGSGLLGGAVGGGVPGLGGLGPIGPSGSAAGRDTASFLAFNQQQGGLLSPSWAAGSRGASGAQGGAQAGGGGVAQQWPQQFLCPLSNQLMRDPVVAADGVTYQRDAITDWLRLRDVSPVTGQPLASAALQPNFALQAAITAELAKAQSQGGLV